jgi:DNA-binding phage protein
MLGEDLISVVDKVLMRTVLADDRPQLLQRPVRGRVRRYVDMSQSARPCSMTTKT